MLESAATDLRSHRSAWIAWSAIPLLTGLCVWLGYAEPYGPQLAKEQIAAPQIPIVVPPGPTSEELAGTHLKWAELETAQRIDAELAPIEDFFYEVKARTPEFSKQALGWSGKWRLMADYVPGTRGDRHDVFLREKFETLLFSSKQLETLLGQAVKNYRLRIDGIENEMLVRIRARMKDFPESFSPDSLDDKKFRAEYEATIARVIADGQRDLVRSAAGEAISLITGEVLTQVAVRMGVSAGILGTGAAASPYTLGIGIVVGVIVDQIVGYIWDWAADPKGELTLELNTRFDKIREYLLDGDAEQAGLRVRFYKYSQARAAARKQAVYDLLRQHGVR